MASETLVLHGPDSVQEIVEHAAGVLRSGKLVVYPTDTSYGIACDPRLEDALVKLIQTKKRNPDMGLPLLFSDLAHCEIYHDFNEMERVLARLFWPGALTIVVSTKMPLSSLVTGGRDSVAVRVPDHAIPRGIAKCIDGPIVGTSANISGEESPFDVDMAKKQLGDSVDLYIDGGPSVSRSNSTIVGVEPGTPSNIKIYREGELSVDKLIERLRMDTDAIRYWSSRVVRAQVK